MMDGGGCMGGGGMGGGGMGGGMGGMMELRNDETCSRRPKWTRTALTMSMFPRPQVDNIVAFLKTLSDG